MPTYTVHYRGRVQGVGFRATCRYLARNFPGVAGVVCNLVDGRVRLTVRGAADEVDRYLARIATEFQGKIWDWQREPAPAEAVRPDQVGVSVGADGW